MGPNWGGAHTLVSSIIAGLSEYSGPHDFVLFHYGDRPVNATDGLSCVRLSGDEGSTGLLDAAVVGGRVDIVWFLTPTTEPVSVPFITTVWDLEHRNHPYFPEVSVSGWTWEERESFYRSTLRRASVVLTGTEECRRQIVQFYQVPERRIAVVPFPVPSLQIEDFPAASDEIGEPPEPYVYYPAHFWPHKNHVAILYALKLLEAEGVNIGAVFTGIDVGNLAHVRKTGDELGINDRVRYVGFVDPRSVVNLYRGALALVYPSFFGPDNLPPLEAFTLECPVIAADVPGAAETLGDAAILVDPGNEHGIADAVRRVSTDETLRSNLIARGSERIRERTGAAYASAVASELDRFGSILRCWSRDEPFEHQ